MLNRKGQNMLEYAILIALVVGAAMAMQTYVKRGINGRIKNAVDHTGTGNTIAGANLQFDGDQYEPYYAESHNTMSSNRNVQRNAAEDGEYSDAIAQDENRKIAGSRDITNDVTGAD